MTNGKIIEVHRYFSLVEMQQDDPEVKAWLGQTYRGIGPYFKDKITATGLTFEEQKILMPSIIGIEYSDKDFRKTVVRFFDELVTSVPKDGLKLQIGLQDESQPLSENNLPLHPMDYIRYRHLKEHRDVAINKQEAEKGFGKKYYILDPEEVSKKALDINTLEDTCTELYMRFKDDTIKVDQILTMLTVNITKMKADEKILKLKFFAQKNPKLNVSEQREAFEKFKTIATDKDLEYKYLITEMIGAQYLSRIGNGIYYKESGVVIGNNIAEAVAYFKNPKNSRELNLLKAEYSTKVKKGDAYLPKEDPNKSPSVNLSDFDEAEEEQPKAKKKNNIEKAD